MYCSEDEAKKDTGDDFVRLLLDTPYAVGVEE
jgi:hypothetical protein